MPVSLRNDDEDYDNGDWVASDMVILIRVCTLSPLKWYM